MNANEHVVSQDRHLTSEQWDELLFGGGEGGPAVEMEEDSTPVRMHLEACRKCAAEAEQLHAGLGNFRAATVAYANRQEEAARAFGAARQTMRVERPSAFGLSSSGLLWATSGLLVLAAVLPFEMRRQVPSPAQAPSVVSAVSVPGGESDEALMEDVNRQVSASVPASMQLLADPSASSAAAIRSSHMETTRP